MSLQLRVSLLLAPVFVFTLGTGSPAYSATAEEELVAPWKTGPLRKLGPILGNLQQEYAASSDKKNFRTKSPLVRLHGGRVGIDLYARDSQALQRRLAALGATGVKARGALISAQVSVKSLGELATLEALEFAQPALAVTRVASQGNVAPPSAMRTRAARKRSAPPTGT